MIIIPGEDFYRKRELKVHRPRGMKGAWLVWEELQGSWLEQEGNEQWKSSGYETRGVNRAKSCMASKNVVRFLSFFLNMVESHWNWTCEQESDMTTFYILPFVRITEPLLNEDWELGIWQGCSSLVTLTVCQQSGGDKGLTEVSSHSDGRWGEDWKSRQLFGIALQETVVVEKWIVGEPLRHLREGFKKREIL